MSPVYRFKASVARVASAKLVILLLLRLRDPLGDVILFRVTDV